MTKDHIKYDRERLVKELASQFAKASGYNVNTNEVSQWEVAADALVKTIEGIVKDAIAETATVGSEVKE